MFQGVGFDERPVKYCSRLLTPTERRYTVNEREALAVVYAVKQFHGYIECSEVLIGSDHQPLRWLMRDLLDDWPNGHYNFKDST